MKRKRAKPKPPINACIYCGATDGRLTKEHVIPKSLGGTLTLLRATCDTHQDITKAIETELGRGLWRDARLVTGLRFTQRPTHIPVWESHPQSPIIAHVPVEDHPRLMLRVDFDPPGMLTGRAKGTGSFSIAPVPLGDDSAAMMRREAKGLPHLAQRSIKATTLARFLAKVALGFAVYELDLDGFDPTEIRKIICEECNFDHVIGGTQPDKIEVAQPEQPMSHLACVWGMPIDDVMYAVVQLQFFAQLGMPVYTVIVGKLTDAGLNKLGPTDEFFYT